MSLDHQYIRTRCRGGNPWALGLSCLLLWGAAPAAAQNASWSATLRGNVFGAQVWENTDRGADGFSTIGWGMGSITADLRGTAVKLGAMASLDPITLGECGYPRLLAQAAPCVDHLIQDRTHAHPLLMDLSLSLRRDFGSVRASLLGALVGEPALGPPSYMHRVSAALEPIAPISHHDTNPAHVSNGVVTAALASGAFTIEASAFNARAGDSDPYDLDLGSLDAWSARAQLAVGAWRAQASTGTFPAAAGGHAGHNAADGDMRFYSASVERTDLLGSTMLFTTVLWSRQSSGDLPPDALLLETSAHRGRHSVFLRAEGLERVEQEVTFIDHADGSHDHIVTNRNTRVGEVSGGYAIRLARRFGVDASIGARAALSFIPDYRRLYYNTQRGRSAAVFVNMRSAPGAMHH